jgi:Rrf2 family nitric oxide-sensitive transcriptional repressor
MRLNKSTSHAIRILIDCAQAEGELVKVAEISARLDLTMQNAFKIVHILSRVGLVTSARGRNGGVRLAKPAQDIAIGDVVRAMESTELEIDTGGRGSAGRDGRKVAGVNRVLDDALEAFIAVLDRHSLAELAGTRPTRRKSTPVPKQRAQATPKRAPAARRGAGKSAAAAARK